jgi:RNA polymerase sigma-70 factor (ECF subfamily)
MELLAKKPLRDPTDDGEIIDLFWQRDEKAIAEIDKKYRSHLLAVAYNVLHDRLDSEECLNDTYAGALDAIPPARPENLCAFLTTVMRRIAVNRYHSNRKKSNVPSEMTVALSELEGFLGEEDLTQAVDSYRLGRIISDFVRGLSSRQRFIFISRYYMASTVDQIAKKLCVSRSTVNKELAVVRKNLKETLESEDYLV